MASFMLPSDLGASVATGMRRAMIEMNECHIAPGDSGRHHGGMSWLK